MSLEVKIFKKLKEFNLEIEFTSGEECVGLMGNSGSGKSMTLKCIAGIETPDQGRIVLNNKVLFDSDLKINLSPQRRNVGYLFQNYALFPNMSVEDNIKCGLMKKGFSKKEIAERLGYALERFHIEELRDRYPRQLSGGQKQRVALARLMVYEPDVVLLDEPFSALDSKLKGELLDEMKKLLDSLMVPAILVSHDEVEENKLAKNIHRIEAGRLIV